MADVYDVLVTVRKNGLALPDFNPIVRRITCDESQPFVYEKATGGGYASLPATQLDTLQLLLLLVDQQQTLRLDGQSDAGLVINAGGLVLLLNVTVDAGASTNAAIENTSGSTALNQGLAAGT